MYAQVEKPKENKSRPVANSVAQKKGKGKHGFGFVDNRPEVVAQRKLQVIADNNLLQRKRLDGFDKQHPIQKAGGKSKKTTSALYQEYEDELEVEDQVYDYLEHELWSDQQYVIDYALKKLESCRYSNWDGTDSSQGNYCRFIWYFDYGVKVGVNIHYPEGAAKEAGHMYIKNIERMSLTTPQIMVDNAPIDRPDTTETWR